MNQYWLFLSVFVLSFVAFASEPEKISSADAPKEIVEQVESAKGLVMRVPVDKAGELDPTKAEYRIDGTSGKPEKKQELDKIWSSSVDVAAFGAKINDPETEDVSKISSTCYRRYSPVVYWPGYYTWNFYYPVVYYVTVTYAYYYFPVYYY